MQTSTIEAMPLRSVGVVGKGVVYLADSLPMVQQVLPPRLSVRG
jgi:hypothetical protein